MTTKFDIGQDVYYFGGGLLHICNGMVTGIQVDERGTIYTIQLATTPVKEDCIGAKESDLWRGLVDRYTLLAEEAEEREKE